MKKKWALLIGIVLLFLSAAPAAAVTLSFTHIEEGTDGPDEIANGQIGENQFSLEITAYNPSQILFTFTNSGPEDSSITDIYFDDDVPMMNFFSFIYFTNGVHYTIDATPPNLPAGGSISFSADYSYDSSSPTAPNGINPGEQLGIVFDYANGYAFDHIIGALGAETMMIGLHAQAFSDGGSESFYNSAPVPEPASLLLLGTGLAGFLAAGRKKLRKKG